MTQMGWFQHLNFTRQVTEDHSKIAPSGATAHVWMSWDAQPGLCNSEAGT